MKGLHSLTNAANRLQAWRDWEVYSQKASMAGFGDLVLIYKPPKGAGWRKIDKCIAGLRKAISEKGFWL